MRSRIEETSRGAVLSQRATNPPGSWQVEQRSSRGPAGTLRGGEATQSAGRREGGGEGYWWCGGGAPCGHPPWYTTLQLPSCGGTT